MDEPSRTEQWEQQLAACEASAHERGSRAYWLSSIYARIYRFLLSRYASDQPLLTAYVPTGASDLPDDIDGHAMPQVAHSVSAIRSTLKQIQQTNVQVPPGPLSVSLQKEDWINLRLFTEQAALRRAMACLHKAGIACQVQAKWWVNALQVRLRDRRVALLLLNDLERRSTPPRKRITQWETAKLTFGLALVLCVPTLFLAVFNHDPAKALVALISSAVGLVGLTTIALWSAWRRYAQGR